MVQDKLGIHSSRKRYSNFLVAVEKASKARMYQTMTTNLRAMSRKVFNRYIETSFSQDSNLKNS